MAERWNYDYKIVAFCAVEYGRFPRNIPLPFPTLVPATYTVPEPDYLKIREQARAEGEKTLEDAKKEFAEFGIVIETRLVEDNDPDEYAIEAVKEEGFDLVALGCKGHHSKLRRVFLGTVAQKVVNEADADVLVVR